MISDVRLPYEILIRFDENGAPKGAHVQYRQRLIVDGVVRADDIQPAEPLSLDNLPASALMTNATRDALIAVTSMEAQIGQMNADLARVQAELETRTAELKKAADAAAQPVAPVLSEKVAAETAVPADPAAPAVGVGPITPDYSGPLPFMDHSADLA